MDIKSNVQRKYASSRLLEIYESDTMIEPLLPHIRRGEKEAMTLEKKIIYDGTSFLRGESWILDRKIRNMQDLKDVIHLLESNGYELKNCSLVLDHDHSDAFPSDYTYDFADLHSLLSTMESWGRYNWEFDIVNIYFVRPEESGHACFCLGTHIVRIYY